MPLYARVDSETGEFHDRNCSECGFLSISGDNIEDPEVKAFIVNNSRDSHVIVEVSPYEKDRLVELVVTVERGGRRIEVPANQNIFDEQEAKSVEMYSKYKIDLGKATSNMNDRPKVDDFDKPIEIETPGGKEIIGYEQKPEPIVTVRQTGIEAVKQI
jgi:hypothetical protein